MQSQVDYGRATHSDASRGCRFMVVGDVGLGWPAVWHVREAVDACQSPLRRLRKRRIFGRAPLLELWEELCVAAVSHGDGDVAMQSLQAGSLQG